MPEEECKDMPEWEDMGGAYAVPKTKEDWKNARLFEWDGGEVGQEVSELDFPEEHIDEDFIYFLEDNGYDVNISIEYSEDIKPLKISKMGRKKIINISPKDELKLGDNVKILRTTIRKV